MKRLEKGLHLHFDPASGIAGDMTVSALVDAGVPRRVVTDAIAALEIPGLAVRFERRARGAYVGTGFEVSWPGKPPRAKTAHDDGVHAHDDHDHDHAGHDHDHDLAGHDHDHDHDGAGHDHDLASPLSGAALLRAPRRPRLAAPAKAPRAARAAKRPGRGRPKIAAADHHHRDYAEIRRLLARAPLDADAKALAEELFATIAAVESTLHGIPIERIGFHEVGAFDSIADIVGASAAIAWLAPTAISATAPTVGTGYVRTAHGLLPVPAPATALLLHDIPMRADGEGELTTPTGAAILATVVDRFGPPPPMKLHAHGFGAGTKELRDRPNVLRVLLGEAQGAILPEAHPEASLVEANIDDMNPQLVEPLLEALFAAGALDAWSVPILMKKGRPALTVSALAPPGGEAAVARAFFESSTTIGVRTSPVGRIVLARAQNSVKTPWGVVSVKLSSLDGRVVAATPEFEDCRRRAAAARVPVRQVLAAASAAATLAFGLEGVKVTR